jgi:hypothetical protein
MFKWAVLKAASAIASSTSSLFYVLLYREIYRQTYDLTQDSAETVKETFALGFKGAGESAERQRFVFRLFPDKPEKIVEYMPLLYQLVFGIPMDDYTQQWDRSDAQRPILRYKLKSNPLTWELGKDPALDNLPWANFWDGTKGYASIMAGMLTVLASYVLKIKGSDKAILVTEEQELLRGDPYFELTCQIIFSNELPLNFNESIAIVGTEIGSQQEATSEQKSSDETDKTTESSSSSPNENSQDQKLNNFFDQLSKVITIDKLEDVFGKPTGLMEVLFKSLIQNVIHMEPQEFLDHFTNYEKDFVRIFGFLSIHLLNELGQLPQQLFKNDQLMRVYGHIFLLVRKNANRFIPIQIVEDLRKMFETVLESLAPASFLENFKSISSEDLLNLYFEGSQKALHDLGITFESLKTDLYEEFKSVPSAEAIEQGKDQGILDKQEHDKQLFEVGQEAFMIAVAILSFPAQFTALLLMNTTEGFSEILSSLFNMINESGQKIGNLLQKSQN